MNKNKIHTLWPIFIGEFHNPNHQEIKKDLIEFFNKYESNNNSREGSENYDLFESNYFLHKENNSALSKVINFIAEGFLTMTKNVNKAELNKIELKMIKQMRKGSRIMITGYNQQGSQTIDHYSLLGFTKVYNASRKACS